MQPKAKSIIKCHIVLCCKTGIPKSAFVVKKTIPITVMTAKYRTVYIFALFGGVV